MRFFIFILICISIWLNLLSASPQEKEDVFINLTKTEENYTRITLRTRNAPLLKIMKKVAEEIRFEINFPNDLEKKLSGKKVDIILVKRELGEVFEILTGIANCIFRVNSKSRQILVFNPQKREVFERDIITKYKKLLLLNMPKQKKAKIYLTMATFLYLNNKPELALVECNAFYNQLPDHELMSYNLILMAKCYLKLENYEKAKRYITQFLNDFPKHKLKTQAFLLLGKCHFQLKDFEKAKRVYKYLLNVKDAQQKAIVQFRLAQTYQKQAEYLKASNIYSEIEKQLPPNFQTQALYNRIVCLFIIGDNKKALEIIEYFYSKFIKNDLSLKVRILHARILFKNKKYFMSYYILKTLLTSKNEEVQYEAALYSAKSLKQLGLLERAIAILEKFKNNSRNNNFTYPLIYELGILYQELRRWNLAKSNFKTLSGKYSKITYVKILECDYNSRNYMGCLDNFNLFKTELIGTPFLKNASYLAGQSLLKLGKLEKAKEMFEGKWKGN